MMDYRDFFEAAFSEAFERAPFSGDEAFIAGVKERTKSMKTKNTKWKKPAVITAAALSAAAVATVTAGAALDWDIGSLFGQKLEVVKEKSIPGVKNITSFYPELFWEQSANPDPQREAAEDRTEEILQKISYPLDETVEFEGYTIHIDGYAFDGTRIAVLYELTYSDELYDIVMSSMNEPKGGYYDKIVDIRESPFVANPFCFAVKIGGETFQLGGGQDLAYLDKTVSYRCETAVDTTAELDDAQLVLGTVRPEDGEIAAFGIDLAVPEELLLKLDMNVSGKLRDGSGRTVTVDNVLISPFGVIVSSTADGAPIPNEVDSAIIVPIYLIMEDDSVIDVSGYGNSILAKKDEHSDGTTGYRIYLSARGNVIDVTNIRAVKLYSEIIELRDR